MKVKRICCKIEQSTPNQNRHFNVKHRALYTHGLETSLNAVLDDGSLFDKESEELKDAVVQTPREHVVYALTNASGEITRFGGTKQNERRENEHKCCYGRDHQVHYTHGRTLRSGAAPVYEALVMRAFGRTFSVLACLADGVVHYNHNRPMPRLP